MDTIYALSSGALPSGVAVIRVSGKKVRFILETLLEKSFLPRYMHYVTLRDKEKQFIDNALVVFFEGPHSFTGEDCAEFHLHGGKAVVKKFLEVLGDFPECRVAQAGEFSKRAFFNGKMDLTEAEGLADLIAAETETQRRLAIMGANKELSVLYRSWRKQLIGFRALLEANIDFSDEEDTQDSLYGFPWQDLLSFKNAISAHIKMGEQAYKFRDGLKIVIVGVPNSGKSSFINRLCGSSVAIVTDKPGTTRDALERFIEIAGTKILIIDTAGIHETDDFIEKMGIEKSLSYLQEADLVLYLEDMHAPHPISLPATSSQIWTIGNKADLGEGSYKHWPIQISAKTGKNFDKLLKKLEEFVLSKTSFLSQLIPARQRQIQFLKKAEEHIEKAYDLHFQHLDLCAEHLRIASDFLGRITGDIDVEDLLDVIFSEFCIGK